MRLLFFISVALTLLLLPFVRRAVTAVEVLGDKRADLLGGVLLGIASASLLLSITGAIPALGSVGWLIAATVALGGFVWRIRNARCPFVPPTLFANLGYLAVASMAFLAMGANLSALVFAPLLAMKEGGLSATATGLVLTPGALVAAFLSPIAGKLSDRLGPIRLAITGLGAMALSLIAISTLGTGNSIPALALGMAALGAGFAFVQSPLTIAAASKLAPSEVGAGMGVFSGFFFLGAAAGPVLSGVVFEIRSSAVGKLNPLASSASAFSDLFLILSLPSLGALAIGAVFLAKSHRSGDAGIGD